MPIAYFVLLNVLAFSVLYTFSQNLLLLKLVYCMIIRNTYNYCIKNYNLLQILLTLDLPAID